MSSCCGCDAGAYGAETEDGQPIVKGHQWITNSSEIASRLPLRMTPEQKFYATPVQGKHTKASGEYCHGLACAILEGLQAEARKINPQRFHEVHEVFYMLRLPSAMMTGSQPGMSWNADLRTPTRDHSSSTRMTSSMVA